MVIELLEKIMPTITVPDATYARLSTGAATVGLSVDQYVFPYLDQIVPPRLPLKGEDWQIKFEEFNAMIREHAKTLPPNHWVDDSRETIYGEREDSQL